MVDLPVPQAPPVFHPFDRVDGKVHAHQLPDPGLATLIVRKDCRTQLDAALMARFGVSAPQGSTCFNKDHLTVAGTAPDAWLFFQEHGGFAWAAELAGVVQGLASVTDQSSGYVVVRVAGEKSREVLQRGVFLDMHQSVFTPGSAAMTDIAHISVLLTWPRAGGPYYLAIPRSYAGSFRHWLEAAAAD